MTAKLWLKQTCSEAKAREAGKVTAQHMFYVLGVTK